MKLWKNVASRSIIFLNRKIFLKIFTKRQQILLAIVYHCSTTISSLRMDNTFLGRQKYMLIYVCSLLILYFLSWHQKFCCDQGTEAFTVIKSRTALKTFQRTEYCCSSQKLQGFRLKGACAIELEPYTCKHLLGISFLV